MGATRAKLRASPRRAAVARVRAVAAVVGTALLWWAWPGARRAPATLAPLPPAPRSAPCSLGVAAADVARYCCAGAGFVCGAGLAVDDAVVAARRAGPAAGLPVPPPITIPCAAVNDDYCDCPDGSDEPGTSACAGVPGAPGFACAGGGGVVPASRVRDGIVDCPQGDDEVGGGRGGSGRGSRGGPVLAGPGAAAAVSFAVAGRRMP